MTCYNYLGYIINTEGEIYSKKTGKLLKQDTATGYARVKLYYNGYKKNLLVHRLVAECFISKPHGKDFVNHKDGNKLNNNVENLEWVTNQENIKHASLNNLNKKKFTIEEIREIRNSNETYRGIQKKFKCSLANINQIKKNKIWQHQK